MRLLFYAYLGDDYLSIYDQNEKEKELESYRIVED